MTTLHFERLPIAAESSERLEGVAMELAKAMRSAPGALWAQVLKPLEDDAYVLASEWRTEADLEAWEGSPEAAELRRRCEPLVGADPSRRRFRSPPA